LSHPNAEPADPIDPEPGGCGRDRLTDATGIQALTTRKLGIELGIEAMSLYPPTSTQE
jgi:hypothetical protein